MSAAAPRPTARDIDTLARTCDGEARGDGHLAMVAVAYVAIKRARLAAAYVAEHHRPHPHYGDGTIAAACRAPEQFSCWLASDPNDRHIEALTLDSPEFQAAYLATLSAITGREADPTDGATHYWAARIPTPSWAVGKPFVCIGRQRFIRLD